MRVFELSREIGIPSKELVALLKKMDIQVKSHMSALTEDDVQVVLKKTKGLKSTGVIKKGKTTKKVEAEAPAPPKKRFVLRKKKPKPAPEVPPQAEADLIAKAEEKEEKSAEALGAPTPLPKEPAVASLPGEQEISPAKTPLEAGKTVPPKTASPKEEVPPAVVAPSLPDKEIAPVEAKPETEVQKKPVEAVPEVEKKDAPSKPREKAKRTRRVKPSVSGMDLKGGTSADARKWQDFKPIHRREDRRSARKGHGATVDVAKPRKKDIKIYEGITVKEFSELIGQKVTAIMGKLMELGKMATINEPIGLEEASLIAETFEIKTEIVAQKTEEELLMTDAPEDPAALEPRPPVITIMGHVDHGKTSLLDAIRETKVTDVEAGGITQHIGAYMVSADGKPVTFLDTPGHAAFTAMRARGAKVTDIVVLVVAADDGVMPQTVEAINHAKAAEVPMIVAINKIDRPDANPDRVKQALSEHNLIPEDWGGSTIYVEVSAKKKQGLDHLLEMILLQAEILELKANPKKGMVGVIVEAKIERGRGPVATVLVQEGTLKVGSAFVSGIYYGKVRALINDEGKKVKTAGPSTPVEVIGMDGVPQAGDTFVAVADERVAKDVATSRAQRERTAKLTRVQRTTLDDLYQGMKEGIAKEQHVIIKADVQGSAEALRESLEKLSTETVKLQVVHSSVGGITESDVMLAAASNSFIVGFNVRPEAKVKDLAGQEKVDIRLHNIIYDVISDVRASMEGLLEPTLEERILGKVEVRQTFSVPKQGTIAGGYVKEGVVARNCHGIRVFRDNALIYEGKLASLRRFKEDVKEVQTGYECGVGIDGFNDIEIDDVLEVYTLDKVATKLGSAS
ncbi:MAG: translation initiation factor IF-2 [Nitrospiria bacterium]